MKTNLEGPEVLEHFGHLAGLLEYQKLPTKDGGKRTAQADEFMLMYTSDDGVSLAAFKHRTTRNYLYVEMNAYGDHCINVANDGQPFQKGYFDE